MADIANRVRLGFLVGIPPQHQPPPDRYCVRSESGNGTVMDIAANSSPQQYDPSDGYAG